MRVVEGRRDLLGDPDRFLDRELRLAIELLAEGLALDVGHDVVEEPVGLTRIEQRQDVRVLEVGGGFDLLHEPFNAEHSRQLGA